MKHRPQELLTVSVQC